MISFLHFLTAAARMSREKFMRILISFLILASTHLCDGNDNEILRAAIKLGSRPKGVFVTTNDTSMPFYLIAKDIDFPSLIGAKLDKESLGLFRMHSTSQYVARPISSDREGISNGYGLISGRYGVLNGNVLTLTGFLLNISEEKNSRGLVLFARRESVSVNVSAEFKEEAEERILKQKERR